MSTSTPSSVDDLATPNQKWAETSERVHPLIRARWSPRVFSEKPVSDDDLLTIFEAARWAASSYNEQPWRLLVARKSDGPSYDKLLSLLAPFNQAWAKSAPVLLLTVGKKTFSHNGAPNRFGLHDAGQALANLALQATALGMHAHAMGGFDVERARQELKIPDEYELGAAVAIGYRGSLDEVPEQARHSEEARRSRKSLDEIVFGSSWGEPLK